MDQRVTCEWPVTSSGGIASRHEVGFGAVKHEARWRQPASRFRESDIGASRWLDRERRNDRK
jgi:hypothetical protein